LEFAAIATVVMGGLSFALTRREFGQDRGTAAYVMKRSAELITLLGDVMGATSCP